MLENIAAPHRLLINRSLRKNAEDLRATIDAHQDEYSQALLRCTAEIDQAKVDCDRDFEHAKESLLNALATELEVFEATRIAFASYASTYFQREFLYRKREHIQVQKQIGIAYIEYLTEQMSLIGKEIELLEKRSDALCVQTRIEDVLELADLCGISFEIETDENAESLVKRVNELLIACDASNQQKRYALRNLRAILRERVECLDVIQYISWVVEQKRQVSCFLSRERRVTIASMRNTENELRQVYDSINALSRSLDEQARAARFYWANPVSQINLQICSAYTEKNALHDELKGLIATIKEAKARHKELTEQRQEILSKLKHQASIHSDDDWTWDRLQRDLSNTNNERDSYSNEISSLESQISKTKADIERESAQIGELKVTRQQWFERKNTIIDLCKRNRVFLIPDKAKLESDEFRIISDRLTELHRIAVEEAELAKQRYREELTRIQHQRKATENGLNSQIEAASKVQAEKYSALSQARIQLSNSQRRDTRLFFIKWFSETDEVKRANQAVQVAQILLESAEKTLSKLKDDLAKAVSDFDRQIIALRPTPSRPTAAEREEMQQLERRIAELISPQGEKQTVSKEHRNENTN